MTSVSTIEDANTELTLRLRQQSLSADFATFGLQADDLQPMLDEACRVAAIGMECTLAKILEFLPDEKCFIMRAGVGWHDGAVGHARFGADLESPAGYAFQTGQPVLSNHLAADTRFRTPTLLLEHGVHRAFNVLVETPERRYGVLEVDSPDRRDFTISDTSFLETLAATLAHAIAKQMRMDELRQSRAFTEGVLDASPDCVNVLSADGLVRFMNHRGLEMNELGSFDDIRDIEFATMWPDSERAAIRAAVARAAAGSPTRMEGFCPTSTGEPRWWEMTFAAFSAGSSDPVQVIGVSRDITERWAGDRALRDGESALRQLNESLEARVEQRTRDLKVSEARATAYFDLSPEYLLLVRVGADDIVTFEDINAAAETVFQRKREDVAGRVPALIVPPDAARDIELYARTCFSTGKVQKYQVRRTYIDGMELMIDALVAPLERFEQGGGLVLFSGRDITDQSKIEEQLRQSQKMEAVGQLTGGLAHDFNNLLTGVTGSLDLLRLRLSQGRTDVERYVEAAQGAAERAAALTHRLLAFSRRQNLAPKATDTNRLVGGMIDLIRRTVGPSIAVEVVDDRDIWPTLVDPSQLENALLNLCLNARDAMPDGGKLMIETSNTSLDERGARDRNVPPGQYVSLSVSDTGTGMAPEVVERAFDPFFTTKPIGAGTGLGLSMIFGFARQTGGEVTIYSEVGRGTMVRLDLPRYVGEADVAEKPAHLADAPRADEGETVLVVDDEPTIRMLVTEVLEDLGYRAIEAETGAAGLEVLQSNIRVDLLVTDVGLPGGMNGCQMADAGRLTRPDMKVLFITGYAENAVLSHGDLDPGMHVMTKPFPMEALARRIKGLIDGPR